MNKVAFCINSLTQGGAEKVALTIIENISSNYSIELICLEKTVKYTLKRNLKVTYLSQKSGRECAIIKFFLLFLLAFRLKKYCQSHCISLVQSHIFRANYVNLLAKILGSTHKAQLVTHGLMSEYFGKNILGKINIFLIKRLYPLADALIANSEGNKAEIIKILGNTHPIRVINNPFHIDRIKNDSREEISPEEFNFAKQRKYIISIGRLIKTKHQSDIIYAFQKIAEVHPNVELIFLGDGAELQKLNDLTVAINLKDRIYFLGNTENPYKFLRKSTILISASESESFGNVLVEAMACGCPIISSDCPVGPAEILGKSEAAVNSDTNKILYAEYGILVPVGDIDSMAEAISILLSDNKMRKTYIAKGLKRCMSFDLDKIIPLYEDVIQMS